MTELSRKIKTIDIDDDVISILTSFCQRSASDKEACGVLIGGYDKKSGVYIISEVTTPLAYDIRSRTSFKMLDMGHQTAVDKAFKDSEGRHIYLGTWHSHPEAHPSPSLTDIEDWKKCLLRNKGRNLFFVIVGLESLRVFEYSMEKAEFVLMMVRSV